MTVEIRKIREWRTRLALADPRPHFMGKPEAWYDDPHWFCGNGHVSGMFLKTDDGDMCLACRAPVCMGPPIGEAEFKKVLEGL